MRFVRLLCSVSVLLGIAAPLSAAPVRDMQDADAVGEKLYRNSGAEGMVLVVVRKNQVFFQGYGETAPRSHRVPDADTVLRLCSLTKIFTSDILSKLAADRTVSLNDPLQRYAPNQMLVPSHGQPITLQDLATHTSGLPREVGYPQDGTAFTFPDFTTRWQWLPRQHPQFTPGTAAHYSNIGYDLLSDALSGATHKSYPNLLHERTLKPLRMYSTTFYPNAEQCARLMVPTREVSPCTVTDATQGSSGLYSTANDMAHWLKYLLGTSGSGFPAQQPSAQSIYLRPEQLRSQQGMNAGGTPSGLGLGWVHLNEPESQSELIQKTGGGAGYLTYIVLHPASHTALFMALTVGPRTSHSGSIFMEANDAILEMAGLPPMPTPGASARLRNARGVPRGAVAPRGKTAPSIAPAGRNTPRTARGKAAATPKTSTRPEKPAAKTARPARRATATSAKSSRAEKQPAKAARKTTPKAAKHVRH